MMRYAILAIGGCVLLAATVRADWNREQLSELRHRLDTLVEAIDTGQTNETHRAAASLRHWARQQAVSWPVDRLCDRALNLAGDQDTRQLRESLRQLSANLRRASDSGEPDLARARSVLSQVLAGTDYQAAVETNWWQQVMARLLHWIDWLIRSLRQIPGAEKVASAMFYVAVALLLVPLLAVTGYLVWWQFQQRRDTPQITTATTALRLESPDTHLARAEDCVRQGHYVEALKQFHLAVLATLEQRGWVTPDRTRTNWEYLAELEAKPAPPESTVLFRSLNRLYDRAVFGTQPCDDRLAREFGKTSQQLMQAVAAGSPQA